MEELVIESSVRFTTTLAALRAKIDSSSVVVEIGAADASFRRYFSGGKWITVDKYGTPDICADINGPAVSLPIDSNSADVVICTEVLEHLTIGTPLVAEISRILRHNGSAFISVPNVASLRSRVKMFLFGAIPDLAASGDCGLPLGGSGVLVDGHWVAGHVVDFNERRLGSYLSRGGLTVTKVHKIPIQLNLGLKRPRLICVPRCLYPSTFCDYVFVEATTGPVCSAVK